MFQTSCRINIFTCSAGVVDSDSCRRGLEMSNWRTLDSTASLCHTDVGKPAGGSGTAPELHSDYQAGLSQHKAAKLESSLPPAGHKEIGSRTRSKHQMTSAATDLRARGLRYHGAGSADLA